MRAGRTQLAHNLIPIFMLGCILPQTAWNVLRKKKNNPILAWLTVSGVGQMDLFLDNAFEPIQIGCELDLACLQDYCSALPDYVCNLVFYTQSTIMVISGQSLPEAFT